MKQDIHEMNKLFFAVIVFLSVNLCSCVQDKIIELPLTMENGYGPFCPTTLWGIFSNPFSEREEDDPWLKTYPKISKFPEGLANIEYDYLETNLYQSAYQNYLLGNITKEWYDELQKSWIWVPDTLNYSKNPVRTKIAYAWGTDSEGVLQVAVDTNNNLDLSDDTLFSPLNSQFFFEHSNKDSLLQAYFLNASIETFVYNKIVPVSISLFVMYNSQFQRLMLNFFQYATTQYKGEPIAVFTGKYMDYKDIGLVLINNLKNGEKVKKEDIYKENNYIEIKDEIYKILGVNTKKFSLVLEKVDLPKVQQSLPQEKLFQAEEFTTKEIISLESLKGKYVLLKFWGVWCMPCIDELPHISDLYSKTDRTRFEIIGIAVRSAPDRLKKAIELYDITWPQISSDEIAKAYEVERYPTTFLIDPEGNIIAKDLRGKELEEKILSLIE